MRMPSGHLVQLATPGRVESSSSAAAVASLAALVPPMPSHAPFISTAACSSVTAPPSAGLSPPVPVYPLPPMSGRATMPMRSARSSQQFASPHRQSSATVLRQQSITVPGNVSSHGSYSPRVTGRPDWTQKPAGRLAVSSRSPPPPTTRSVVSDAEVVRRQLSPRSTSPVLTGRRTSAAVPVRPPASFAYGSVTAPVTTAPYTAGVTSPPSAAPYRPMGFVPYRQASFGELRIPSDAIHKVVPPQ